MPSVPIARRLLWFRRRLGQPERFPVKAAKVAKPRRYGTAFVFTTGDVFVAEQRPDKGLLGGMLGVPHTPWRDTPWREDEARALLGAFRFERAGAYEHVFTHFALSQEIWVIRLTKGELKPCCARATTGSGYR